MKKNQILKALECLNEHLKQSGIRGEICIVGGAAMVLAFQARAATKDIDAIFEPAELIRKAARSIADELQLPTDWLNDAVKGYLPGQREEKKIIQQWDYLTVWVPPTPYLLAMKAVSARFDSQDAEDLIFLIKKLKLTSTKKIFSIISKYYPDNQIPSKTRFFVEEVVARLKR